MNFTHQPSYDTDDAIVTIAYNKPYNIHSPYCIIEYTINASLLKLLRMQTWWFW